LGAVASGLRLLQVCHQSSPEIARNGLGLEALINIATNIL
jgi:hypothetical protein